MPTVTNLLDRVCGVTGLASTGSDRALVLGYVNQAYAYSVLEMGGYTSTFAVSLTAGVADYTIGTAPISATDILEIRSVWITDSSGLQRVIPQVSEASLLQLRRAQSATDTPLFYALRGTRELLVYPAPLSGTTLSASYLAAAPDLVESAPTTGQESTPTAIPSPFHYDVIANRGIALAMEYDNRFEEAAAYDAKWASGLDRLRAWVGRFGGPVVSDAETGYVGPRDAAP